MTGEIAFCYAWHFSMRRLGEAIKTDLSGNKDDDVWIGVEVGKKYYDISVQETNEFLRKYLI